MAILRRSVSKLLQVVYPKIGKLPTGEVLYDTWKECDFGEAVIGDAFAALELAVQEISGSVRMKLYQFEEQYPSDMHLVFTQAVEFTESTPED